MKLEIFDTGGRTKSVWANGECVGNLIQGFKKPWAFVDRLDYLGVTPRAEAKIRAGVADHITLLNIARRLIG